jgi:hypothetical protein
MLCSLSSRMAEFKVAYYQINGGWNEYDWKSKPFRE